MEPTLAGLSPTMNNMSNTLVVERGLVTLAAISPHPTVPLYSDSVSINVNSLHSSFVVS